MFSQNPAGAAVQLVKWYQCMAVHWQLNNRHHIQISKVVHLDSYETSDLWSAVLQPQVIPYSRLQYFSTLSLNCHDFLKKHFLSQNVCFDFLYNLSLKHFLYKKSRTRINQKCPPVFMFLVRFTWNFNFPGMFEKYSSTKFHEIPSMCTDRQTDRHDEAYNCFSQFDALRRNHIFVNF